jgi:hypothetical protein
VGVDPDDEHEALLVAQPVVMPRRALLMRVDCSRLFRATPQQEPGERPLRSEANQQPVGKAFLRPPAELSEATTTRSSVRSDNHQGDRCTSPTHPALCDLAVRWWAQSRRPSVGPRRMISSTVSSGDWVDVSIHSPIRGVSWRRAVSSAVMVAASSR